MQTAPPYKAWLQKVKSLRRYCPEKHSVMFRTFTVTLSTAKQSFHNTHWLMVMHHHTKFGYKRSSSSEDTVQKKAWTSSDSTLPVSPPPKLCWGRGRGGGIQVFHSKLKRKKGVNRKLLSSMLLRTETEEHIQSYSCKKYKCSIQNWRKK